jgi:predicted nucleotide-binding protein
MCQCESERVDRQTGDVARPLWRDTLGLVASVRHGDVRPARDGETVKERFEGEAGRRRLIDALLQQKLVLGNAELAEALAESVELLEAAVGDVIITQEAHDNDVFFILTGRFTIVVNGRELYFRHPGDHVGEMVVVEPTQARSATVKAAEVSVVGRISEETFAKLADRFPQMWRTVAKELSRRLRQRNVLVAAVRTQARVFIISSAESLDIARAIQTGLAYDPPVVVVWENGVFRASKYSIEALEEEVDKSDFGVVVAAADDVTFSRGEVHFSPRDNVTFELGFFMGRLGRFRTLLLAPRGEEVKLPSDLRGLTALDYVWRPGPDAEAEFAPTVNRLRAIFEDLGPIR